MDTDILELEIITRIESKKIPVEWIDIQSPTGNFIIGPDHSPLVSLLKERGVLTYKVQALAKEHQGDEVSIDTYGGIIEVDGSRATAILDYVG